MISALLQRRNLCNSSPPTFVPTTICGSACRRAFNIFCASGYPFLATQKIGISPSRFCIPSAFGLIRMSSCIKAELFENSAAKCNGGEPLQSNSDPKFLSYIFKSFMRAIFGVFVMVIRWHGETVNFRCSRNRSMRLMVEIVLGSALKRV